MAITWGASKTGGSNGIRLGYEFTQSPATVGTGTSSVTVTLKLYIWTMGAISDSSNSLTVSGDFSFSGSVSVSTSSGSSWSTSNQQLIKTINRTFSPLYGGAVTSSFSGSLSGIEAVGGSVTATASGSTTTAKRPPYAPDAPTAVTVARTDSTRHTVSWTRTNATDPTKIYDTQTIQRADVLGSGSYVTISTLAGSSSSFVDTSTVSNKKYRYRVRANNDSGSSAWAYSPTFYTAPISPTDVKAAKSGGDITVSWTRRAHIEARYEVEDWANGVATTPTILTAANAASTVATSPDPAKTHAYQVRAFVDDATFGRLYSVYSARSATVQLMAPPNAPTNLAPSGNAADGAKAITLSWRHNPVDTTAQTYYSLRHRAVGASTWTTVAKTASPTQSYALTAGTYANGTSFEWQVQTWGDHATGSEWSAVAVVPLSATPIATILSPETVLGSKLTAQWAYADPESTNQSAYRVTLIQSGQTLETYTGSGSASSRALATRLDNGGTYTLKVAVRDGAGLWSADTSQVFTVSYAPPPSATATAIYDTSTGAAVVEVTIPGPGSGEVDAVTWHLERHTGAGDWVAVTNSISVTPGLSESVVDPLPAVNALNRYRVITTSELPSTATSAEVILDTSKHRGFVYVNAGPGFSQVIKFADFATASVNATRERVFNNFAGRSYPVATTGETRDKTVSVSGRLGDNSSTPSEVEALMDLAGTFCVRAPYMKQGAGGNVREFVQPNSGTALEFERIKGTVSLSFRKVDFIE
ncbi:hypothetical protein HD598_002172 [Neomicrococcus aestuarii]|uniref:Fibronectin type-III domain-containing protein n=1 Tax=Neomicrococcus aestuarii TaxID=556325 RepID=A0A7W8X0J0_9MICC|nr:fibronectin type III domain-containing protein [Neomicrococcus aestuarii]MBB5513485.1 hypothetical protein [Neomicrococcus aestuarii]